MTKTLSSVLALGLVVAVSSPAFACSWNKTASTDENTTIASSTHETMKEEEAMSTFDPATLDTATPAEKELKIEE